MNRTFISTSGSRLARAECDAKGHWSVEFLLEGTVVNCLAADPHNRNVMYAGTQDTGVLRSDDRGKTWLPLSGMENLVVKAIAVSPVEPGLIVAGTKPPGIYISRDSGRQWTELLSFHRMKRWFWFTPAEPGEPYVQSIALSPTDSNLIVVGVEFGAVLRSVDGGNTWEGHLKGAIRDCHALSFHATDGNWVYEAGGIWRCF